MMAKFKNGIAEQRLNAAKEAKTRRENELQEILVLLHKGLNYRQIAKELGWPESLVLTRLKLGTKER